MTGRRYVTDDAETAALRESLNKMADHLNNPTPAEPEIEDLERFRLYRLCACAECEGRGKLIREVGADTRCRACRGEGRSLDLVATCPTPEAVGVALVTLGREGEWAECPVGVLDTQGAKNQKWILSPWLPSARNVTDAARTLAKSRYDR